MAEGGIPNQQRQKRTLECSICLERFRNPKTLPCLHSYCKECLVNYAPKGTKTLLCPQCKEECQVPNGDANQFKSNFHLRELVDEAALTEQVTRPSAKVVCNCCDAESEAVSRCVDCDQYLCASCVKAHSRFPSLRDHLVAGLEEIKSGKIRPRSNQKRQPMCLKHPSNKAEIFCTTCERLICHVCMLFKHSVPNHTCIEATEAAENMRKRAAEGVRALDGVISQFADTMEESEKAICRSPSYASELNDEVEGHFEYLVRQAKKDKSKLLAEIDGALKKEDLQYEKYKDFNKSTVIKMRDIQEHARMTMEEACDGDFLSFYGTVKSKIDQMCLMKPKTMVTSFVDTMSFKPSSETPIKVGSIYIAISDETNESDDVPPSGWEKVAKKTKTNKQVNQTAIEVPAFGFDDHDKNDTHESDDDSGIPFEWSQVKNMKKPKKKKKK